MSPLFRRTLRLAPLLLAALACAAPPGNGMQAPPPDVRPLAAFAAQRVVVLPAQRLRQPDSTLWKTQVESPRAFLAAFDEDLMRAFDQRGLAGPWAMSAQVVRSAQRNASHAPDPRALAVTPLIPRPGASTPQDVAEPLASQLRTLAALNDARYVLVPVELRFERGAGAGRAVLRAVLIDTRAAEVAWGGDVASDTTSTLLPALATSAAHHLADRIAAR